MPDPALMSAPTMSCTVSVRSVIAAAACPWPAGEAPMLSGVIGSLPPVAWEAA